MEVGCRRSGGRVEKLEVQRRWGYKRGGVRGRRDESWK